MSPRKVRSGTLGVLAALAMVLATAVPLAAQATGTVRGQVTDAATQRPLGGAQISLVGTQRGGLANSSGQFLILNVPVGTYTVRAEIIGFAAQETEVNVTAGQVAVANFALSQQAIDLEELVVTGTAGRTQKRAIGNSVTSVKTESLTEVAPINDVNELLTARAPGLTLMGNGGEAGSGTRIRIRGAGSLNAGLDPVIYVDGVRIESSLQGNFDSDGGSSQAQSPLDAINPDDIESIEVIKGPAAATLYGAEAAGGVIQIITKKGRAGIQGIQWTAQMDYGQTGWDVVDTPTNYWLCTESNTTSASYPGCHQFVGVTDPAQRLLSMNPIQEDPATNRTGNNYGVNVSARGGAETYNYYLSVENNSEEGVFYNNFARRTGGRANFGFVPTDKLNFNMNVGYVRTRTRMPLNNNASNGVLRNGFRGRAGALDDPWKPGYRGFSPELSNQYNQQIWGERLTMGLTANYNPTEWFSNRLTLGLDRDDRRNREFYTIDTTGRCPWGSTVCDGASYTQFPLTHRWTIDYSGTVNFDFAEDYTSAFSAGMQFNSRQFNRAQINGIGFIANNINLVSQAATTTAAQGKSEQTSLGFFVQEQVGWQDKLYATAAVRVDDNSAFGEDFSLVVYPKASLSYVISDEDWFDFDFVDQLKLRTAWGQAGNAPAPFSADRTFGTAQTSFQDQTVNYLTFAEYGNPDLKAETGQEFELGFESSILEGKVGIDATYYYQQTKDALISIPDPPSSGWSGSHLINIGEIKNQGLEVLVNASPVHTRTVEWNSTVGLNFNSSELRPVSRRHRHPGRGDLRSLRLNAAAPGGVSPGRLLVRGRGAGRQRAPGPHQRKRHPTGQLHLAAQRSQLVSRSVPGELRGSHAPHPGDRLDQHGDPVRELPPLRQHRLQGRPPAVVRHELHQRPGGPEHQRDQQSEPHAGRGAGDPGIPEPPDQEVDPGRRLHQAPRGIPELHHSLGVGCQGRGRPGYGDAVGTQPLVHHGLQAP